MQRMEMVNTGKNVNCRERLTGIGFIRAVCAVGIILYHYSCHSASAFKMVYVYPNAKWGDTLVTVFFVLSGAMLFYNYESIDSLKVFYYKRLKALLPAFYIGYLFCYLENVFASGRFFYAGPPWKFVETLFAMDGYLRYREPDNYYIIGEWFLGAIIMLYLLYPLILWVLKKSVLVSSVIIVAFYIWGMASKVFVIEHIRNMFSCILSLYVGMLMIKYKDLILEKARLAVVSVIIILVWYFVKIPIHINISTQLVGFSLFIVLYHMGRAVEKYHIFRRVFSELGNLSYPIFLLQHRIILKMLGVFNPIAPWKVCIWNFAAVLLTIVYAKALSVIVNAVLKSKCYCSIEKRLMGNRQ